MCSFRFVFEHPKISKLSFSFLLLPTPKLMLKPLTPYRSQSASAHSLPSRTLNPGPKWSQASKDPLEFALLTEGLTPSSDPSSDLKDGLADLDSLVTGFHDAATECSIWASGNNQPISYSTQAKYTSMYRTRRWRKFQR